MEKEKKQLNTPHAFERIVIDDIPQRATRATTTKKSTVKPAQADKPPAKRGRPPRVAKTEELAQAPVEKTNVRAGKAAAKNSEKTVSNAAKTTRTPKAKKAEVQSAGEKLHIIPLGGIGEIGKNITMYECGNDSILVDCGMSFPDDEMPGVDIVIPDFSYIVANKDNLRALLVTHGHEDHIGAIPYLLKQVDVPIYATRLTIGLIEAKLSEHQLPFKPRLNVIEPGYKLHFGSIGVEPIRVNHSIPDAVAFAISTPAGLIVQTGDFKVDFTPVTDKTIDLTRFAQLGEQGVLALLSDSTNAEKPGSSVSESHVGESLERLFSRGENKRIIIATFASNIQRVQQIINLAKRHNRKIALSGRSMENNVRIANELGYLDVDDDILIEIDKVKNYAPDKLIIITTGSQGEPMSALSRMAAGTHRQVSVGPDDMIIISATPIPGNEKTVTRVINALMKLGSDVIYERMYETHASGHACQDEQKLMLQLVKPKFFMPVHGEYKHLAKHAGTAKASGVPENRVIFSEIGSVIEFQDGEFRRAGTVPAGRVLVDGLGVGDVGSVVLRDRKHLAQDGVMVVACTLDSATRDIVKGPDIISRGFVYVKESEPLIEEAKDLTRKVIAHYAASGRTGDVASKLRDELQRLMDIRTKRSPMIIPVLMEI